MSRPATSKRLLSHSLALYLAVLGAASMAYYHQGLFIPRSNAMLEARGLGNGYSFGNDFYQIWLASRLWFFARIDPYSPEMTRDIQIGLYGRPLDPNRPADLKDRRIFPYPAFAEILFWPAALFPFTVVRVAVLGLLIPATVATVLVWMRALSWHLQRPFLLITLLLVLCSYPALEGFYAGQVGLLVGFLFAASILSIQQGRLLQSGVLLGLTTIKPQVIVLAALYLLAWTAYDWRKRRSFCVGFVGTVLLLVGGAFVIWPHWISSWLHVVVMYRGYTGPPLVQELLTTMGLGSAATPTIVVTAACIAVALTLAWQNRSATSNSLAFWWTLGTLLAITVIALLPRQAVYDHGILLPGIFLIVLFRHELSSNAIRKALLYFGLCILLWPWFASEGLVLLRPLMSSNEFYSKGIFSLPLRTAAVFPFVVLGLLTLLRPSKLSAAAWSDSTFAEVDKTLTMSSR